MTVNILISVYNRIDSTLECLSCIDKQTYGDLKVILIDDGSTDGTYGTVREKYPEIDILRGDGSLWWTGAMHMGVEHVLSYAENSDFILSLNNDTAFDPEFIESIVRMSEDHDRSVVGSMEKDFFHREKILYLGEWLDWKHYRFNVKTQFNGNEGDCNEHVNVLPGRGLLIPVEIFKNIGNFNKAKYPHYIADYEFTMRAYNSGIRLILSYKSVIYSRSDLKGISSEDSNKYLSLREAYIHLFSRRSMSNIMDHINFIRMHCPHQYKYRNIARALLGAVHRIRIINLLLFPFIKALHILRLVKQCITRIS